MRLTAALTVVGLALTATPGLASPIIGTGSWRAGQPAQENLGTYWDGNSWDSTSTPDAGGPSNPCNAGSLVGGSPCGLNAAAIAAAANAGLDVSTFQLENGGAFEYWGQADGSADLNYGYGEATGAFYDFSILGEFTDDWAINEIGFYDLNDPANRTAIFQGSQTVGAVSSVFISGNFGLYYRNTAVSETFFTQSMLNGASGDKQQFASFQIGDQNFVGIEDIFSHTITQAWTSTSADYDYNDVMIGFRRTSSVPEPSSLLLMGMGLAAVLAKARRKARA